MIFLLFYLVLKHKLFEALLSLLSFLFIAVATIIASTIAAFAIIILNNTKVQNDNINNKLVISS